MSSLTQQCVNDAPESSSAVLICCQDWLSNIYSTTEFLTQLWQWKCSVLWRFQQHSKSDIAVSMTLPIFFLLVSAKLLSFDWAVSPAPKSSHLSVSMRLIELVRYRTYLQPNLCHSELPEPNPSDIDSELSLFMLHWTGYFLYCLCSPEPTEVLSGPRGLPLVCSG